MKSTLKILTALILLIPSIFLYANGWDEYGGYVYTYQPPTGPYYGSYVHLTYTSYDYDNAHYNGTYSISTNTRTPGQFMYAHSSNANTRQNMGNQYGDIYIGETTNANGQPVAVWWRPPQYSSTTNTHNYVSFTVNTNHAQLINYIPPSTTWYGPITHYSNTTVLDTSPIPSNNDGNDGGSNNGCSSCDYTSEIAAHIPKLYVAADGPSAGSPLFNQTSQEFAAATNVSMYNTTLINKFRKNYIDHYVFPDSHRETLYRELANKIKPTLPSNHQPYAEKLMLLHWMDNGISMYAPGTADFLIRNQFSSDAMNTVNLAINFYTMPKTDPSHVSFIDATGNLPSEFGNLPYVKKRSLYSGRITEYVLESGDHVAIGDWAKGQDILQEAIFLPKGDNQWYDFIVPPDNCLSCSLTYLFETGLITSLKFTARYIVPFEDIFIVVTGENLDGEEMDRKLAAGMLVIGFIPGGKVLKPVTTLASNTTVWKMLIKVGDDVVALPTTKLANGIISFGTYQSAKFRKLVGLVPGDARQAHHIIPRGKSAHELVQLAAKHPEKAFHIDNGVLNGIPLNNTVHNGSHAAYDAKVLKKLDDIMFEHGNNPTPEQAYNALESLISTIKTSINNNPNTHVNNLIF